MNPQDSEENQLFLEVAETHVAAKGDNSTNHYNLVHKFFPMQKTMQIPDAEATVEE